MADNLNSIIRIYPQFTEVRENLKEVSSPYQIYFPQDLYNQIMSGSLNLEGVAVTSINAILRENNLEGKDIHINKDKQIKVAKMIRSSDSLVQDLETKRYYNVSREQIEFSEIPEETGTEVTFTLENAGPAVLSYLMYGISWKPRYSFNITGDNHSFQGWADITNNTKKDYTLDKTELFGGDVQITQSHQHFQVRAMMCADSMPMARSAPKIQSEGEVAGLYMYSISDRYTLAPRSTYSLPFIEPKIEFKRIAYLNTYFSEGNDKGQASRVYRVKSDQFLPNGSITIREDGRVVGQSNVPDLSAGESTDLSVGNDAEVLYDRKVKSITKGDEASDFEVTVTVRNKKSRAVNFEYCERFSGRFEVSCENTNVKVENDYAKHEGSLDANGEISFVLKVKIFCPSHSY